MICETVSVMLVCDGRLLKLLLIGEALPLVARPTGDRLMSVSL